MYDRREMKYEQKIKDNFSFVFLCKKYRHYICRRRRRLVLLNYLRQRQMFFVAMRYRAAALFLLFLHGKDRGMSERKREGTWFKDLLEDFYNGNWKKDFRMSW